MTVSKAIITWLKGFNHSDYWKMKRIDTDIQSAQVDSYALLKEPIRDVKSYINGKKEYTEHYTLMARLSSQENREREDNIGFGEALEDWVEQQNMHGNYPEIDGKVNSIGISTPFYCGATQENNSVYQLTVIIRYEKQESQEGK